MIFNVHLIFLFFRYRTQILQTCSNNLSLMSESYLDLAPPRSDPLDSSLIHDLFQHRVWTRAYSPHQLHASRATLLPVTCYKFFSSPESFCASPRPPMCPGEFAKNRQPSALIPIVGSSIDKGSPCTRRPNFVPYSLDPIYIYTLNDPSPLKGTFVDRTPNTQDEGVTYQQREWALDIDV